MDRLSMHNCTLSGFNPVRRAVLACEHGMCCKHPEQSAHLPDLYGLKPQAGPLLGRVVRLRARDLPRLEALGGLHTLARSQRRACANSFSLACT